MLHSIYLFGLSYPKFGLLFISPKFLFDKNKKLGFPSFLISYLVKNSYSPKFGLFVSMRIEHAPLYNRIGMFNEFNASFQAF